MHNQNTPKPLTFTLPLSLSPNDSIVQQYCCTTLALYME